MQQIKKEKFITQVSATLFARPWFLLLAAILLAASSSIAQEAKTAAQDPKMQREINEYGADIDITIHRQYKYLQAYAKNLLDEDIQAVPYMVDIIQPKREWQSDGKEISEGRKEGMYESTSGRMRFSDNNTLEIIQHGFVYDDENPNPDPIGRRYKTLKLKFSGSDDQRQLAGVDVEVYEKNYKERTYFWVNVSDSAPITEERTDYQPDDAGHTETDKTIKIARRSNMEDAEQMAKEMMAAKDGKKERIVVEKDLKEIKNTPATPLRNKFKNEFYRRHLAHFSNIVFVIYENHTSRMKNSDNYMLDFLRDTTTY